MRRDAPAARAADGAVHVIQGREVRLPVEVRDASAGFATFVVKAAAARPLLPRGLELVEPVPGRALVSIAAIEYRDNDLGRYDEVAVALIVRPGGRRLPGLIDLLRGRVGAYIHRLPVTTSFSCDAGREIWGFPKIVADVAIEDVGERRTATLRVDGEHVLTLSVLRRGRLSFANAPLDSYACRDGTVWKTPFVSSAEGMGMRPAGATLTLGRHPIAEELKTLGLPRRPLVSGWIGRMRARFGAAEPA